MTRIEALRAKLAEEKKLAEARALTPDEREEADLLAGIEAAREEAAAADAARRAADMAARVDVARAKAAGDYLVAGVDVVRLFPLGSAPPAEQLPGKGVIVVRSPKPEAVDRLNRDFEAKIKPLAAMMIELLCESVVDPDPAGTEGITLRGFSERYPEAAAQAANKARELGGAKVAQDKEAARSLVNAARAGDLDAAARCELALLGIPPAHAGAGSRRDASRLACGGRRRHPCRAGGLIMLEDLQGLLDSLSASVPHASASLASLRSTIDSLRASAAATPTALAGLNSSVRGVGAATAPAAAQTNTLSASIGQSAANMLRLPGPIGAVQDALSRMGAAGQAAAAALGAATIVVTAMVASLTALSVAAVSVVEKLSMMRSVLGAIHGAAAGNGITAMVQRLSGQLPIASDQLAGWAKSLSFVAQNGKQLETMMRSVAAAQALMGDSGAAAATSMLETLGRGGAAAAALVAKLKMGLPEARAELAKMGLKTVDLANALGMTEMQFKRSRLTAAQFNEALQKALQRKGAGPLGEMAATWPVIIMKAKEGFLSLFDKLGPAVKPFMHAVQKLFGEFSKGGSVVNTVKPIVTSVLTTLFSWATKAVHAIHEIVKAFTGAGKAGSFFSGAIVVLKAGWTALSGIFKAVSIALTPAIALLKAIFTNALVLRGLKVIFTIIVAAVTAVVVAFAALGAVFGAIAGIVGAGMAALAGIPAAMAGLAGDMIAGLVGGIANGAGAVAAAMSGLAGSALGAFKGVLGIASPSKVMMEHGDEDTAGAFAGGMDKGGAKVKSASKRLGEAAKPGKGKGAAGASGEPMFQYNNCTFVGTTEDIIRRMMSVAFEQLAGEAGAEAT